MHKIMGCFFFLIVIVLSTKGFTMNQSINSLALTTYDLAPGKPLTLVNTTSQTLNVRCQMSVVSNPSHSISIIALNGNGQINGTSISKGQTMILTVNNMQVIPISASSGAKASFTNLGPYIVTASCA